MSLKRNISYPAALFAGGLAIVMLAAPVLMAEVVRDFTAVTMDNQVVLRWTSGSEEMVSRYTIQRSFDGERFFNIGEVSPIGSGEHYEFTDDDLFKGRVNTYYYRIEVSFSDGRSEYSTTVEVTMSSSGIARTWGSIKAMFR